MYTVDVDFHGTDRLVEILFAQIPNVQIVLRWYWRSIHISHWKHWQTLPQKQWTHSCMRCLLKSNDKTMRGEGDAERKDKKKDEHHCFLIKIMRTAWALEYVLFCFRAVIPLTAARRRLGLLFIAKCDLSGANKIRRIYRLNAPMSNRHFFSNWNVSSHHVRAAK